MVVVDVGEADATTTGIIHSSNHGADVVVAVVDLEGREVARVEDSEVAVRVVSRGDSVVSSLE